MRRFLAIVFTTMAVLGVILTVLDIVYSYSISRHPLYNIPKNKSYDYMIVGDSRVSSILEYGLDTITKKRCLVITIYGGETGDIKEAVNYFFRRGNKAETVIASIDPRIGSTPGVKHDWLYYAHAVSASGFTCPRLPFMMYVRKNKDVTLRRIIDDYKRSVDTSRTETRDMAISQRYAPHKDQMKDYSAGRFGMEPYLELGEMLKSRGVKNYRLLTAPLSPEYDSYQSKPQEYKSIIAKTGLRHYDFSESFKDTSSFADLVHLKRSWYMRFTGRLADALKDAGSDLPSR